MSNIFPGVSKIKPRQFGKKSKKNKVREVTIFPWVRDSIGRPFIIAGHIAMAQNNPQWKVHANFGGEGPNGIAYKHIALMEKEYPDKFEEIRLTCPIGKQNFKGVVHKYYDRVVKAAQGKEIGGSTHNEHYSKWKKPATKAEMKIAMRIVSMITW